MNTITTQLRAVEVAEKHLGKILFCYGESGKQIGRVAREPKTGIFYCAETNELIHHVIEETETHAVPQSIEDAAINHAEPIARIDSDKSYKLRGSWVNTQVKNAFIAGATSPEALAYAEPIIREKIKAEQDKFKAYVHSRLDAAGVPTHPEGEHSKAGCRIGDRLDIVLGRYKLYIEQMQSPVAAEAKTLEQIKDDASEYIKNLQNRLGVVINNSNIFEAFVAGCLHIQQSTPPKQHVELSDDEINKIADTIEFSSDGNRINFMYGMEKYREAIRKLSPEQKAVVDPVELLDWFRERYVEGKHKFHFVTESKRFIEIFHDYQSTKQQY